MMMSWVLDEFRLSEYMKYTVPLIIQRARATQ